MGYSFRQAFISGNRSGESFTPQGIVYRFFNEYGKTVENFRAYVQAILLN